MRESVNQQKSHTLEDFLFYLGGLWWLSDMYGILDANAGGMYYHSNEQDDADKLGCTGKMQWHEMPF